MSNTIKVALLLDNIGNDTLNVIGAGTYNTTAYTLAQNDTRFWIETWLGNDYLCTTQTDTKSLTFTGVSNSVPFSRVASPFVAVECFGGGHPIFVPKPPTK